MKLKSKILSALTACAMALTMSAVTFTGAGASETTDLTDKMEWGTVEIGGGGFVSGIVTGQKEMYLRTDVGGAYKYNYETGRWEQLLGFLNETDKGLLSISGIAIDPTDDDTVYFLCGCAYFSDARTEILKTTDGGKTFTRTDVTDMIQCHANGDGRECCEPIAIDPDDPNTIYAGGDVTSGDSCLIKSTDGGKTWNPVKGYSDAVEYPYTIKWPYWTDHMVKAVTADGEQSYNLQNGISTIHIEGGKVYVGTSVTGQTNIHVADVDKDVFTELSADLPTDNYPVTISSDYNGNLFVTYIAGLAFSGTAGGAYKYNIESGKVTDISPSGNAFGMVTVDKSNPNNLLTRTCGVWSDQWYEKEWTDTSIAWGDHFYRSTDGGETWTDITPGQQKGQYTDDHYFVSEPIDINGYKWIYGKACHWGSGILLDPRNPDKIVLTSGNGVFACDNVWAERGVQFYFDPAGVEEVVALDMVSIPGGPAYSAIGDYDGYKHTDVNTIGLQHYPNMGSTGAIGYCPQNPKVLVRFQNDEGKGYYTTDGGDTWTAMANAGGTGGRATITQLDDGKYRIFHATNGGKVQYTDDFGDSWSDCSGLKGSKVPGVFVEPDKPNIVYVYTAQYNEYWSSDTTKKEPTLEDANYALMVSNDYGATFTSQTVCKYDACDVANKIGYLGEGQFVLGAGYNGAYISTDFGKTTTKLENVFYCKTISYGAPEKEGDVNTLYMFGRPQESDPEGIYRSQDAGQTWALINKDKVYGGPGNGNFLVGDLNEFGMVYMSTVGCGIVYGRLSDNPDKPDPSETNPSESSSESSSNTAVTLPTGSDIVEATMYGDVNLSGDVDLQDLVALCKYFADSNSYPLSVQALANADVVTDGSIGSPDSILLSKYVSSQVTYDELGPQKKD